MALTKKPSRLSHLGKLLDWLLPSSLQDVFRASTELLHLASAALRHLKRPAGLYEVLDYQARLELLDPRGCSAIYEKRERVRFLKDCGTGFYDYGWGDGEAFASHRVRPGRIVERRQLGPRYRSLIALPSPKKKGEIFSFVVRRRFERGFMQPEQWWLDAELYHRVERLSLAVVFPASRLARRAWVVTHPGHTRTAVSVKSRRTDGRQEVRYRAPKPRQGERYTLQWEW